VAVRIRLKRMGKVRTPFYRIVVSDSRTKRDGRVIEEIGTYNPKAEPSIIQVDSERAQHWLSVGAQPSTPVAAILKLTGDWQKFKGEGDATPTLRTAEPARDKTEIFNEALKEAHGDESRGEAVTKKAAPRKSAEPAASAATSAADSAAGTGEGVQRADKAHAGAASGEATAEAQPGGEQPGGEQPGGEQAGSEQPSSEQAGAEPSAEQSAEQPKTDEA
jgi:small subunit ribosomal protein S16